MVSAKMRTFSWRNPCRTPPVRFPAISCRTPPVRFLAIPCRTPRSAFWQYPVGHPRSASWQYPVAPRHTTVYPLMDATHLYHGFPKVALAIMAKITRPATQPPMAIIKATTRCCRMASAVSWLMQATTLSFSSKYTAM